MHDITTLDCSRIAQDLQIRKVQVEAVVQLLDEGNTVPFITRYRKERTGGLNEEIIRQIQSRVQFLRQLADRKQTILKSIEAQGKLTDDLRKAILASDTTKRLEDLYLPYKPKKKSLATAAREKGLEPLALAVWNRDPAVGNFEELLASIVNPDKSLASIDDVRTGVQHILAEMIAETADVRAVVRSVLWETGRIKANKSDKLGEGQGLEYKDYFDFTEPARLIPAHRILALNRGEKENAVKVHLDFETDTVHKTALHALAEYFLKREQQISLGDEPKATAPTHAAESPPSPVQITDPALAMTGEGLPQPSHQPVTHTTEPNEAIVQDPYAALAHAGSHPQHADQPPVAEPSLAATGEVAAPMTDQPATSPAAPEPVTLPPITMPMTPVAGEALAPGIGFLTPHAGFLRKVLDDALTRLLLPSLEREIRHELTDEAETHAVGVFARNLRSLLMQPPLHHRRVLAIDPGMRTGCKIAALDEFGNLLDQTVIYPFGPQSRKGREKKQPEQPATPAPASAEQAAQITTPTNETPAATVEQPAPLAEGSEQPPATPSEQAATPTSEQAATPTSEQAATPAVESSEQTAAPSTPVADAPGSPEQTNAATTEATPAANEVAPAPVAETPAPAADRKGEAKAKLKEFVTRHNLHVVALGNGTGCRETEEIIAELIGSDLPELAYVIVNEAGASVYSVSAYGREEFPTFDSTLRSTISIGRRLQDPLSELVKVDPPNIGVGLYQHDINRKDLRESLDGVVESCVNQVGVDLNTASVPLLRHVSGLNQLVARELVDYRQKNGAFTSREQIQQVPGVGPTRYVQAAGFLKIPGANPLDRTWIHPESYPIAEKILEQLGYTPRALEDRAALDELQGKLKALQPEEIAQQLGAGVPTVYDILQALARPGRDPREDLPPPIFKKGILRLENLEPGMELRGTVLNVVDFGAFVDIGLKESGLVHISQMANRYIKSPYDVVAVSDVVTVWVLNVDKERHRVSLTMIQPGTERKPPERKPQREGQRGRPPRERRPGGPPPQGQGPPQQGQGQSQGQGDRRRPPRGRHGQGRPQPASSAAPVGEAGGSVSTGDTAVAQAPPPSKVPPPPPRKPRREPPKPKLSQAALEGKAPLRTFSELSVLFATKKDTKDEQPPAES